MNSIKPGWSRNDYLPLRGAARLKISAAGKALEQTKSNLDQETEAFVEAATRDPNFSKHLYCNSDQVLQRGARRRKGQDPFQLIRLAPGLYAGREERY